ncbi:MAG: hypothetical protein ACKVP5_07680 [Aestuariivirga sp.]
MKRHTFQTKILEGIDLSYDLLNWIPKLEAASNPRTEWANDAQLRRLGPTAFGRVAMAAVEQYAKEKKLNPGTVEPLRLKSLNLFLSASTLHAFHAGQATALARLRIDRPELNDWVDGVWVEGREAYNERWRAAALNALEILREIRDQNARKGQPGNPGRSGTHAMKSPDAMWKDVLDSHAIAAAANSVGIAERNDPAAIRAKIRAAVIDLISRGEYGYDENELSLAEAVDRHTRRVQLKFDDHEKELTAKGLVSDSIPSKK